MNNLIIDFLAKFPEIETKRLILKKHFIDDVDDIFEIFSSDKVTKYLRKYESKDIAKKQVERKIEKAFEGTRREWVIELKEEKKVIGVFSVEFDIKNNCAEISYVLNERYWSKGYAIEAAKKMLKVCSNLKIHRVEADCVSPNIASIKLLKKLGMKHEGAERNGSYNSRTNEFYNFENFGILINEHIDDINNW